jgi:hypothetical protein
MNQHSFLGNGHEIEDGTTWVARQQISKIINKTRRPLLGNGSVNTFPRQRITIQEWTVLSARAVPRSYKEDNWGDQINTLWKSEVMSQGQLVKGQLEESWKGAAIQRGLERGSWRISTVRSRYQGTAGEDTAGWKRRGVCCGDLRNVEISNGAVITCSLELCCTVVNQYNLHSKPPPVHSHTPTKHYE